MQAWHLEGRRDWNPVAQGGGWMLPGRQVASFLWTSICRSLQLPLKLKAKPGWQNEIPSDLTLGRPQLGRLRARRKPGCPPSQGLGQRLRRLPRFLPGLSLQLSGLREIPPECPKPRVPPPLPAFWGGSEFSPSKAGKLRGALEETLRGGAGRGGRELMGLLIRRRLLRDHRPAGVVIATETQLARSREDSCKRDT